MQFISEWDIYWITRLDNFRVFFILACVTCIMGIIGLLVSMADHRDDYDLVTHRQKLLKRYFIPLGIVFALVFCLTPTTREFAAIKVIPAVANNEDIRGLGQELVALGKDWLTELRSAKAKSE